MLEDSCINIQKSLYFDINIGEWVLVDYFGDFFPGKITDHKGDSVSVSCLEKAGNYFKYPIIPDMHWYSISDIIATLHEPELKTTRGCYSYVIKKKIR